MTQNCSFYTRSAPETVEALLDVHWGLPLMIVLCICSFINVIIFAHSVVKIRSKIPFGDRRLFLVRLSGLFPVYSLTSLVGIFIPRAALICSWIASIYLAGVLHIFALLIVDYFEGYEGMKKKMDNVMVSLAAPPLTCCFPCLMPHVKFTQKVFHRLRVMVVQTAYIRPICVFIAALMWSEGVFIPSLDPNSANLYLTVISLVSTLVAMYALSVIYNATREEVQPFMAGIQFGIIKAVLITTNLQNMILGLLVQFDRIPCTGPFNSPSRLSLIYNMLVIFEMFFYATVFKIYYHMWMKKNVYGQREPYLDVEITNNGEAVEMKETRSGVENEKGNEVENAKDNKAYEKEKEQDNKVDDELENPL